MFPTYAVHINVSHYDFGSNDDDDSALDDGRRRRRHIVLLAYQQQHCHNDDNVASVDAKLLRLGLWICQ